MKTTTLAFLAFAFVPALQAQVDQKADPPIVLPKIEINESIPPSEAMEEWRYAKFGDIEVISNIADRHSKSMLLRLQKFRHALNVVYPVSTRLSGRPITFLLCRAKSYKDFIPPENLLHGAESSRLLYTSERAFIVVDGDREWWATDRPEEFDSIDPYRLINAQYLRYLFNSMNAQLPLWLEEGLLQTISDLRFYGAWLEFGKVDTEQNMPTGEQPLLNIPDFYSPNPSITGLSFNQVFAHYARLPLNVFFEAKDEKGLPPSSESAWAKQAYAFVHFCMFGNKLRYRAPLSTFVNRLQSEPLTEDLFKECFGISYKRMEDELGGYIRWTRHKYQKYPLKPEEQFQPIPVDLRDASETEVALIKGEALAAAERVDLALQLYRIAYMHQIRTPDFLAAYANAAYSLGDRNFAQMLLDLNASNAFSRPSSYAFSAKLRLEQCKATPAGLNGKLSDSQLAGVLEPLFLARKLSPSIPQTYELIAEAWSSSNAVPTLANLLVLDEGIKKFPKDRQLLVQSFSLYRSIGETEKAASIAKLGMKFEQDRSGRAIFENLLASVTNLPALR